ncbi:type IV pilus secretin PilQ [Ostreibacterium oceani]|nr:type IV pilus secretin PilQ [Ostreibacterium oceani]
MLKQTKPLSLIIATTLAVTPAWAGDINSVISGRNADGAYEIQLIGSGFSGVSSYSLNEPAKIVIDIPNGKSNLTSSVTEIKSPLVTDIAVIEGDDRVRATINLTKASPYKIVDTDNKITIAIQEPSQVKSQRVPEAVANQASTVDFKRGAEGQGVVEIALPHENASVDIQRQGTKIIAQLRGSQFGQAKRLNVQDFGTPAKHVDIRKNQLQIDTLTDNYEIVSYQSDNRFLIELSKPLKEELDQALLPPGDSRKQYDGEPLSLNFQDIEVRAVLQLIGDFTNTNIVVSDEVSGSITLRLNDVPWDQALDIILQTKGLGKEENSGVIYVAPAATIAGNKRAAYDIVNVERELAPTQSQLIQIQYARAENLEKIIRDTNRSTSGAEGRNNNGLLSARGTIAVDPRTNTLIVNDVPSSIQKVRALIGELDVAVNQVLIDARIVSASNDFTHELGIRWGGAFVGASGGNIIGGGGSLAAADTITSSARDNLASGSSSAITAPSLNNRLGVNLGSSNPTGILGVQLLGSDFLLDLELSALENEGRGEIISSPRVITQDGNSANISQGTEIPYTTRDDSGTPTVAFKEVNLELNVTPKIAPNQMVDMILEIDKDTVGALTQTLDGVVPSINTNNVSTQVLVDNGQTVVLGGVYEQTKTKSVSKVPVLGDLPVVGRAFRRDLNSVQKSELLIFVTPKIVDKRYVSEDKFSEIRN